jgi:putative FmdB family regulatory protein
VPLYDYACEQCGHTIEVMHGVNDAGPERCDRCGGRMRKLLSSPAIVFKGSGWAKKDARAARPTGAKSATDTQSDSQPAAPDDAKADKPAAPGNAESGTAA